MYTTIITIQNPETIPKSYLRCMSKWTQIKAFGRFMLVSKTKFDVHSPFLFDFITNVVEDKRLFNAYSEMEAVRTYLLQNNNTVVVEDFGAGSQTLKKPERKIASIAKTNLTSAKFGRLLFRIVNYYNPATILELGTSLGVSTLYLAKAKSSAKIITLEGSRSIAHIAQQIFKQTQTENIDIITGEFGQTLEAALQKLKTVDFVYIDGNHREKPTIQYFEKCLEYANQNCILVFDDIHWSREMEQAWKYIQHDTRVTLSIDLFYKGIVFLNPAIHQPMHIALRF